MKQVKISFIIAISNLFLSAYYLFIGLKMSALYTQFNAVKPNSIFDNRYFLGFLILSLLSFIYWFYLRKQVEKDFETSKKFSSLILLFLSSLIIYLMVGELYSLIIINIIIPLTA